MLKCMSLLLGIPLILCGPDLGAAPIKPELLERGKRATALVEVTGAEGEVSGSAFCVDESGLFITNAHVVQKVMGEARIRLVLDIGLASRRSLTAWVLRRDDNVDLALLQANAGAVPVPPPLEMGRDADRMELEEVTTFGYPFGRQAAVGRALDPDITVLPSRITALRKERGRLAEIQFDNQINPGNSGGPVLDESGRVVGVAVATLPGAALNSAIPVGRLADFLATPGLLFELPPVPYESRTRPATWTIRVVPPTPVAKLPESLSIALTVKGNDGKPRTYTAKPVGDGVFEATVTPDLNVDLCVRDAATRRFLYGAYLPDHDLSVGDKKFRLSDLDDLFGGESPRVRTRQGQVVSGAIRGLGKATRMFDNKPVMIDLKEAIEVTVQKQPLSVGSLPAPTIEAVVEAKQGSKVLATLSRRSRVTVTPATLAMPSPQPVAGGNRMYNDNGLLNLGAALDSDGAPRGAANEIRPPRIAIPAARRTATVEKGSEAPLVRSLAGTISDVAVGGGGRFLLLTLKDVRKLAVFDVNAADVVKTINLPSANALVSAGARKLLIAFPDERLLQRWDLATLQREEGARLSPIKGQITRLVLGSDSDGPALACWQKEEAPGVVIQSLIDYSFSFLDLDSLTVLKVGPPASTGTVTVSTSRGSFKSQWTLGKAVRIRASAGGALFGIWDSGYQEPGILSVHGNALRAAAPPHRDFGHLVPGPDGRTVFTRSGGRLDADGQPVGRAESPGSPGSRGMLIPSYDPSYYLGIAGLSVAVPGIPRPSSPTGTVTVTVHAADGSPLLSVHGLDEMAGTVMNEIWVPGIPDDFTTDKRFHLVPAAHLLITIPPTNDRLVLRRLDLDETLDRAGGDRLRVVSTPTLTATAGRQFEHQIVARSNKGGITFTLARGPDGLELATNGKLTWAVPRKFRGADVTAVITVGDASGQEIFHTLKIRVE